MKVDEFTLYKQILDSNYRSCSMVENQKDSLQIIHSIKNDSKGSVYKNSGTQKDDVSISDFSKKQQLERPATDFKDKRGK